MSSNPQTLSRQPLRAGKQLVRASASRKRTVRNLCACASVLSLLNRPFGRVTGEIAPMPCERPR